MKLINKLMLTAVAATALLLPVTQAQANEQFIALPSYRVGPYAANGTAWYGGFIDYLNYVNLKEGGVNGVKLTWEECETEYNNAKGVECYERLKSKDPAAHGTAFNVMSTGIAYALIDKSVQDKVPLMMARLRPHRRGGRLGVPLGLPAGDHLPDADLGDRQVPGLEKQGLAGRQEDRLPVPRLGLWQGTDRRRWKPRRRSASSSVVQDPGGASGQRAGRAMAEDPPGKTRLRDLLGLGRDESDRAQGGAEGRLSARADRRRPGGPARRKTRCRPVPPPRAI